MRRVPTLLLLAVLLASAVAGCAGSNETRETEQQFRQAFRAAFVEYRQYEPAKALARGESGRWAYGFARGQDSPMQAVNAAKQQCERRRARYGVAEACQTYAVGDDITGDPSLVEAPPSE